MGRWDPCFHTTSRRYGTRTSQIVSSDWDQCSVVSRLADFWERVFILVAIQGQRMRTVLNYLSC